MNAKVELSGDAIADWLPDESLCETWINAALACADKHGHYVVSVRFVDKSESTAINNQYRGKNSASNVLSFPANIPGDMSSLHKFELLGDIVLCPKIVAEEADSQGKSLASHWAHLLIHGLLHLLAYNHQSPDDTEVMEALEIEALERLGIPNPYLLV